MTTNREISEAFKQAKQFVAPMGNVPYICVALERCDYRGTVYSPIIDTCKNVINRRLGEVYSLESWLFANVVGFNWEDKIKTQATRHAWLDSLIEEFDIDGDYTGA